MAKDSIAVPDSDDYRINIHDAWQVLWWCQFFGVTKTELEEAIQITGSTAVEEIQQYLSANT